MAEERKGVALMSLSSGPHNAPTGLKLLAKPEGKEMWNLDAAGEEMWNEKIRYTRKVRANHKTQC